MTLAGFVVVVYQGCIHVLQYLFGPAYSGDLGSLKPLGMIAERIERLLDCAVQNFVDLGLPFLWRVWPVSTRCLKMSSAKQILHSPEQHCRSF